MPKVATTIRAVAACGIIALANAAIAPAQVPIIPAGTRVRIDAPWPNTGIIGKVDSQAADTIVVQTYAGTRFVPVAGVKRIDVSAGRSHANGAAYGMKIGALGLGGTVAGLLVVTHFIASDGECGGDGCIDPMSFAPVLVPAGVIIGGLAGALIGVAAGTEQWYSLYYAPPRASVLPERNGLTRVGFSYRF